MSTQVMDSTTSRRETVIERPKKRQKIAAACDQCRERKVRCDGLRPVCTPCSRRGGPSAPCFWGHRRNRGRSASKQKLSELQQRLQTQQSKGTDTNEGPRSLATFASSSTQEEEDDSSPPSNAMLGLMEEEHGSFSSTPANSSISSFLSGIKQLLDQSGPSPGIDRKTPGRINSPTSPKARNGTIDHQTSMNYVLPPRQIADALLKVYWRLVYPLYPFLDRTEFEVVYRRLWDREDLGRDGKMFICLLNVIFSLASNLDLATKPEERDTNAKVFYERSQELLDVTAFQHRSLLTVQCYLVLGQYLQSTNDPQRCWMFIGLAIRTAQSLGLDLPTMDARATSTREKELFRIVWHGCVLMDRTLSMTFGRPTMIAPQDTSLVPQPAPHADKTCSCFSIMCDQDTAGLDMHFFIEALKLYELMSEALAAVYDTANSHHIKDEDAYTLFFGSQSGKVVGNILDIDGRLQRWARGLPIHLQYGPDETRAIVSQRQSHVLWLRFLHIRILLLRPVLSRLCSTRDRQHEISSRTLPWKIASQLSLTCVEMALDTVDFFASKTQDACPENVEPLLPAWWYSIFYIYSAAMVLAAAQLHPGLMTEVGEARFVAACNTVIKVLNFFQRFGSYPKRCALAVHLIFDQVRQRRYNDGHDDRDQPKKATNQSPPMEPECNQIEGPQDLITNTLSAVVPESDAKPTSSRASQAIAIAWEDESNTAQTQQSSILDDHSKMITQDLLDMELMDAGVCLDLNDMTWLNSIPTQLYNF